MEEELMLQTKLVLTGKLVAESGLHVGGTQTALDIGGIDNPVIREPSGLPYIPGSSLKGKLRSLLEKSRYPLRQEDKRDGKGYFADPVHRFKDSSRVDGVMKIFGMPAEEEASTPVRGIFRDCPLDEEYFEEHREELFPNLETLYTEDKMENTVDRIQSRATPRHLERVPRGGRFDFEIILSLYGEEDEELVGLLLEGLELLEDDYLGGSGSRGSGEVKFRSLTAEWRDRGYYEGEETPESESYDDLEEARAELG